MSVCSTSKKYWLIHKTTEVHELNTTVLIPSSILRDKDRMVTGDGMIPKNQSRISLKDDDMLHPCSGALWGMHEYFQRSFSDGHIWSVSASGQGGDTKL